MEVSRNPEGLSQRPSRKNISRREELHVLRNQDEDKDRLDEATQKPSGKRVSLERQGERSEEWGRFHRTESALQKHQHSTKQKARLRER